MNWTALVSWQWAAVVGALFPLVLLVCNEILYRCVRRNSPLAPVLRTVRNLLLPAVGLAAMLHLVLRLPPNGSADRVGLTIFWTALLFVVLQFVGDVIFASAPQGTWRSSVPGLFRDMVRFLLVGVGAALIYSRIWHHEIGNAITALGIGSLVIGLALQEPLGNVFSGLLLLFERPVELGDWIDVNGKTGKVVEMSWRTVNLETITREIVIVSNSSLYKSSFSNLSRPTPVRTIVVGLSFSFGDPPFRVKQTLLDLALETPGVLASPKPAVRLTKFDAFDIRYEVDLSVSCQEAVEEVRDEYMTRVWYAAQRAGLVIASQPQGWNRAKISPSEALAIHPRFQGSLNLPDLKASALFFTKGELLLKEGDTQSGLCVMLEGTSALTLQSGEVSILTVGDFYGEDSILAGGISRTSLVALSDVKVARFDLESSRRIIESSPKLAREVGETIDRRHRALSPAVRAAAAGQEHSNSGPHY